MGKRCSVREEVNRILSSPPTYYLCMNRRLLRPYAEPLRDAKTPLNLHTTTMKKGTVEFDTIVETGPLLTYNLIRLMTAQAALLTDPRPRQLSFKHTLQLWLA